MSLSQAQLVKWSLPTLALILGLFWYKRRRVDRVDPGGSSKKTLTADEQVYSSPKVKSPSPADQSNSISSTTSPHESRMDSSSSSSSSSSSNSSIKRVCDSGINSDDSSNASLLNASMSSPAKEAQQTSATPRKVSVNLDIPGRSSAQSAVAFSSTPWYEYEADIDDDEEEEEIKKRSPAEILGSQPAKDYMDLLSKSQSSAELLANAEAIREIEEEQKRQEEQASVVVASATAEVQEFEPEKKETSVQEVPTVTETTTPLQNEEAPSQQPQEEQPQEAQPQVQLTDGEANGNAMGSERKEESQASLERDSANQSPLSGVLDGSVTDELRSEGSTDSGKGGSIKENCVMYYEFLVPETLVGKLIGRSGRCLANIRHKARVRISVRVSETPQLPPPELDGGEELANQVSQICAIEGRPENINTALRMIRKIFPERNYPYIQVNPIPYQEIVPAQVNWMPQPMPLQLNDSVNNDVVICCIDKPNHLFVQIPTHPSYPALQDLTEKMTLEYDTVETPPVPDQLSKGMIVVGKLYNQWVRLYVENPDPNGEQTIVRLVDYGGYWTLKHSEMRKIRADYLLLPFQAIEVYINAQPIAGDWTKDAFDVVTRLTSNSVGQAHIIGYSEYTPIVTIFYNVKVGYVSLADELKARFLAIPLLSVPAYVAEPQAEPEPEPEPIPEEVVQETALSST